MQSTCDGRCEIVEDLGGGDAFVAEVEGEAITQGLQTRGGACGGGVLRGEVGECVGEGGLEDRLESGVRRRHVRMIPIWCWRFLLRRRVVHGCSFER